MPQTTEDAIKEASKANKETAFYYKLALVVIGIAVIVDYKRKKP